MALINPEPVQHDEDYSAQSQQPSYSSPISTPPMKLSTIEGCETPHTTIDDNTYFSEYEPRKNYWDMSSDGTFGGRTKKHSLSSKSLPSGATPQNEKEIEHWNVLSKKSGSVAAYLRSLRADAPESEGHSCHVEKRLKTH